MVGFKILEKRLHRDKWGFENWRAAEDVRVHRDEITHGENSIGFKASSKGRNHALQIDSVGIKAIIRQIGERSIEATQPVAAAGRSVLDRCGYPIQGPGRGIRGVLHREA